MSIQSQVLEKLIELINLVNAINTNAKKIDELPEQTTLVPSSKIHVSNNGTSESLTIQQIINASLNSQNDQILIIGALSLTANDLTIPLGVTWKINNIIYTKSTDTVINIPFCATGLNRKDIIIADTNGVILRIAGLETIGIVFAPPLPLNTILITEIDISDSTIGTPTLPIVGISRYKGEWNAATNTPTLVNGVGTAGDYFIVSVAGTGYGIDDRLEYNGSEWYKAVNNNQGTGLGIDSFFTDFIRNTVNTFTLNAGEKATAITVNRSPLYASEWSQSGTIITITYTLEDNDKITISGIKTL